MQSHVFTCFYWYFDVYSVDKVQMMIADSNWLLFQLVIRTDLCV